MDLFVIKSHSKPIEFTTLLKNPLFYKNSDKLVYFMTDKVVKYDFISDCFSEDGEDILFIDNCIFSLDGKQKFLTNDMKLIDYKLNTINFELEVEHEISIQNFITLSSKKMLLKISNVNTNYFYYNIYVLLLNCHLYDFYTKIIKDMLTNLKPLNEDCKYPCLSLLYNKNNTELIEHYVKNMKTCSFIFENGKNEFQVFILNNYKNKPKRYYSIINLYLTYDTSLNDQQNFIEFFYFCFDYDPLICKILLKQKDIDISLFNKKRITTSEYDINIPYALCAIYDLRKDNVKESLIRFSLIETLLEKGMDCNSPNYILSVTNVEEKILKIISTYFYKGKNIEWMNCLDFSDTLSELFLKYGAKKEKSYKNYENFWKGNETFKDLYERCFDKETFITSCHHYHINLSKQDSRAIYYLKIIEMVSVGLKRRNIQETVFDMKEIRDIIHQYV